MFKRNITKILSTILAITIVFCSAPFSNFSGLNLFGIKANAIEYTGSYGTINWSFDNQTGILNISGYGEIEDYVRYPWSSYSTLIKSIVIADGITSIGYCAFKNYKDLSSIKIPDSVTHIDGGAFDNTAYYNNSRNWNNNVLYIGKNLIAAKNNLSGSYIIESKTKIIADYAFLECTSLTSVTIPDSVTHIGDFAFRDCTSLKSIKITDNIEKIGSEVFYNTAYFADSSNWNNDVLYIGNYLIAAKDSLSGSCTIKPQTKVIAEWTFANCKNLTSVTIPDSVISIGDYTFYHCKKLESITIPDSVTSIGDYTFYGCTALTSVTIPDSMTSIGKFAFDNCAALTSVTIPDSVTSIGNCAFYDCISLTSVTIPDSVTYIGNSVFDYCSSLEKLIIPASLAVDGVFEDCKNIKEITFTKGDGAMYNYDFYGPSYGYWGYQHTPWYLSNCPEIVIEDGVTNISDSAFKNCTGLKSITIPASVTRIEEDAFKNCQNIADVYYNGTKKEWNKISIADGNEDLINANIHFPECKHEYEIEAEKEPTCTKNGFTTYVCAVCNNTYTTTIFATGHNYKSKITIPTCTEQGYTTYTCSLCGDSYKDNFVPALGMVNGVSVDSLSLTYKDISKIVPDIKIDDNVDFKVEYSSSNPAVVSIDKDGNITTTGTGEAEITVTVTDEYGNVVEDTCKATVSYAWWQWLIIIFLFGWIWY